MILNPFQAFVLLKNIPWATNGSHKNVRSDESSLNLGLFLAQGMFFEQNKCLEWIQNHNKPLVWPLTCYLKQIYFGVFLSCIVKSMGSQLWVSITLFRDVSRRAASHSVNLNDQIKRNKKYVMTFDFWVTRFLTSTPCDPHYFIKMAAKMAAVKRAYCPLCQLLLSCCPWAWH